MSNERPASRSQGSRAPAPRASLRDIAALSKAPRRTSSGAVPQAPRQSAKPPASGGMTNRASLPRSPKPAARPGGVRPASAARSPGIDWRSRPGTVESLIPVWGSTREAVADAHAGNVPGALGNAALAVTDLVPAKAVGGFVLKGATKAGRNAIWKTGSNTHGATRKWLGKTGQIAGGEHAHHWAIPNGGWGKAVPDFIKNQPWNYLPVSPSQHKRLHGRDLVNDLPEYGWLDKAAIGTPTWAKGAAIHGVSAAERALDDE